MPTAEIPPHLRRGARKKAASTDLRVVPFHGDEIATLERDGTPYVAMRRIVENMGMQWARQAKRLQEQSDKFSCSHMCTTGSDGKTYSMLCMPVAKLPLWLATINPKKVRVDLQEKVERYQAESAIALHDYWTKGVAVRGDLDGIVTGLDPDVMRAIGGMMKGIVHKELATILPGMVETALLQDERAVVTSHRAALDILVEARVPPKKRRALSQRISGKLRRFSAARGRLVQNSRETGRYLFAVDVVADWLKEEGRRIIADHMAKMHGQGVLPFPGPKA